MKHEALKQSRYPLYLQVAETFRQRILKGVWAEGSMLPTLDKLKDEFGVAKVTVRQAVKILAEEGLIESTRGRGTTVLPINPTTKSLKLGSKLSDLIETYSSDEFEVLEQGRDFVPLPEQYSFGDSYDSYWKTRRLHCRDGQNYCIATIYLAEHVFLKQAERYEQELVLPVVMSNVDIKIVSGKQTIVISKSDIETATMLDVAIGDPTADICRIFYDDSNRIFCIADLVHRGDYIQLEIDLAL